MSKQFVKIIGKVVLVILYVALFNIVSAQTTPFYREIQQFKRQDSVRPAPSNAILLVGSSSFTKWTDVREYFPGFTILNRGFGGSSLTDVIRYADEIIFPYQPKQIIIYCGENDLAGNDSITGEIVFDRFKQLFELIRNRMPGVPVAYVSMKPSPSREKYLTKMETGNRLIKKYLRSKKKAKYIDVYHAMFDKEGKVMQDIFIADRLHMNAKGYAIWQKIMAPYLVK